MGLLQITLARERRAPGRTPEEMLDYLLSSLGFRRNVEIYRKILLKLIHNKSLSSGDIARGTAKRTTTIYHVSKLVDAGLLVKRGNYYEIRGRSLEEMIEYIERDVQAILDDLKRVARRLDEMLRRW